MNDTQTVLVTGATGKVGHHVVAGLVEAGVRVRALTRWPAASRVALPDGAEAIRGDVNDAASVEAAANGADAAFLLWPSFDPAGADAAVKAMATHVDHIVYLSAASIIDGVEGVTEGVWSELESLVASSGTTWTFVRGGGFARNTLAWAETVRGGGPVRIPFPEGRRSLVHERDLADAAVAALLDPTHHGRAYVLTGPEPISQAEQVRTIADVVGAPARVEEQPRDEAREEMLRAWGDAALVDGTLDYWESLVDSPDVVTDGVQQVTGHPARTYREWAEDHVDDFTPLTTGEVGERYLTAFREGRVADALAMLADDVVRVAPLESGGDATPVVGVGRIMENAQQLDEDVELVGVDVVGPFLHGDQFAARFSFDEVVGGKHRSMSKMSLCTVQHGRISREEVFYFDGP